MPPTSNDLPSQKGRTALITGANSGIGLEAARSLAAVGAHVIMACRNTAKGETAAASIRADVPDATLEVVELDLASLDSVRGFTERLPGEQLDLLINNAGRDGAAVHQDDGRLRAAAGDEPPRSLRAHRPSAGPTAGTAGSRVVNVSSTAHKIGRIDFEDLQSERSYHRWRAYGQSKLANLLFTFELDRSCGPPARTC